jgi:hypothetical protein
MKGSSFGSCFLLGASACSSFDDRYLRTADLDFDLAAFDNIYDDDRPSNYDHSPTS